MSSGDVARTWNLAADVSPDVLAGNPHADHFGNRGVWHFYTEPVAGGAETGPVIPAGSLLAKWQSAASAEEKRKLVEDRVNRPVSDTRQARAVARRPRQVERAAPRLHVFQ